MSYARAHAAYKERKNMEINKCTVLWVDADIIINKHIDTIMNEDTCDEKGLFGPPVKKGRRQASSP
jgi:hypothetical protein